MDTAVASLAGGQHDATAMYVRTGAANQDPNPGPDAGWVPFGVGDCAERERKRGAIQFLSGTSSSGGGGGGGGGAAPNATVAAGRPMPLRLRLSLLAETDAAVNVNVTVVDPMGSNFRQCSFSMNEEGPYIGSNPSMAVGIANRVLTP